MQTVNTGANNEVVEILLIDDHLPDIVLTRKAFESSEGNSRIHIARDGEEAVHFLMQEGEYADSTRPDLIFLDINLPKLSGYEVLEIIKRDVELRTIPVIMLTSSDSKQDIKKCYSLYANSYLVKPDSLKKYIKMIQRVDGFWCNLVKLHK